MSRDALVVGINTYTHLKKLRAPATDAEAIAQRLEQDGDFRVRRLPEAINQPDGVNQAVVGATIPVSKSQLKRAIVELFKPDSAQIPDTALLYFSGHGTRDDLGIQEGYLASSETNPDIDNFGLSLSWLRHLLAESPVQQQIVWLDCCHSGALLVNVSDADPGNRGKGKHRCFIASSRDYQSSWQDLNSPYSVLTKALLEGLNPAQQLDRWVTNFSLTDFIHQALQGELQSPVCNNSGEPINLTRNWRVAPSKPARAIDPAPLCPYKGLEYFDDQGDDPTYFFGREALTDQLLDKVRQSNFVAIVGASGSGKSSVLRAGLLHQLKLGRRVSGSDQWQILVMRPDARPLHNLALAFVDQETSQIDRASALNQVKQLLDQGAIGLENLVATSTAPRVVLVVDQFEEVFTLCQDSDERQKFFECLLGPLAQMEQRLCVVIAMRVDFVGRCLEKDYSGLAEHIERHLVSIRPMNREELTTVVCQPAALVGLVVEPALVDQMVEDIIDEPGGLPLLEYTLTELWKEERQRNSDCLQLETYQSALQGVRGTLDKRATAVYETQFSKAEQAVVRRIFLALTQLGEGTEDTRRRILQQDLVTDQDSAAIVQNVLKILTDEKLVVTSKLEAKGQASEPPTVEVAHEVLIRHWHLLRDWVQTNRENLHRKRRLEYAYKEWRELAQGPTNIPEEDLPWLQGAKLAEIEEWINTTHPKNLSKGEREYVEKSIEIRDLQRNAALERERKLRKLDRRNSLLVSAASLGLAGIITISSTIYAQNQQFHAIEDLTSSAEQHLESDEQLEALIDSVEALHRFRWLILGRNELKTRLAKIIGSVKERNRLDHNDQRVKSVSISSDSRYLVSATQEGDAYLWTIKGKQLGRLEDSKPTSEGFWSIRFSPDSKFVAASGLDGEVRLWDIQDILKGDSVSVKPIYTYPAHDSFAFDVSFSLDGQSLVSSGGDGKVRLWQATAPYINSQLPIFSTQEVSQEQLCPKEETPSEYPDLIYSTDFHPNDPSLIAYGDNRCRNIVLWNWESNEYLVPPKVHRESGAETIFVVRFSTDGRWVASASGPQGIIRVWDSRNINNLELLVEIIGHPGGDIYGIWFIPNSNLLVSGGDDHLIKIWDLDKLAQLYRDSGQTLLQMDDDNLIKQDVLKEVLKGHSDTVNRLAGSSVLASSSDDGTVRLWSIEVSDHRLEDETVYGLISSGCSYLYPYLRSGGSNLDISRLEACQDSKSY